MLHRSDNMITTHADIKLVTGQHQQDARYEIKAAKLTKFGIGPASWLSIVAATHMFDVPVQPLQ